MPGASGTGRSPVLVKNGKKLCSRCNLERLVSEFARDRTMVSGYSSTCKECRKSVNSRTPEQRQEYAFRAKYGITVAYYQELYTEQEGRCAICNVHSDVLCVDHEHSTKKVRGLLCRECNFGLGKFADDPNRLLAAAAYLMNK